MTDTSPPVPEQQQTTTVSPTDSDAVREGATDLGDITALEGAHFPRNSLDGEGDRVDYYRFTLTEAKQIGLGLRQQDVNADLFLEDAEGNVLHSGTEAGTASEGILETLLAGTYYVRVETQEAGQNDYVFRYGVTAADPAEVTRLEAETNAAPTFGQQSYAFDLAENADGSTTRVALGTLSATDPEDATLSYSIEGGNSADLFEIDASTGALSYKGAGEDYESGTTSYELTVRASDGSQYSDVTAAVNISDVEEQAEPEPLISQEQQAAAQQTVSEPDGEDFPAGTSTAGRVVVGGSATGNIGRRSDVDWFAVELAEGSTYVIDLRGRNTGDGTLLNPYLFGIRDASGYHISGTANDNGGEPWNSRVIFTATESGTHFIAAGVGSWPVGESYTGTYTLAVSKVTDDLSADTGTRGAVAVGSTATGEIEFADDVDWFAVTLEAGKTYRFDLEGAWTNKGTLPSPALRGLYDATGARIDDTTDFGGGVYRNSQLYFTATTSGTYYVAAEASGDLTGSYTLAVAETTEDVAADISTTATVAVGGSATGEIEQPNDRDWFAVTLEAGKTYRFDLEGDVNQSGYTLWDTYLWGLHDATGALIDGTTDNDGGGARDSRLNFTASTSGTYYVAVGANEGQYRDDTGSYILSVADITVDVAADASTTATVAVDGTATGNIETVRDRDWFAVTLEAGKTYRFDLEGTWTNKGTLSNPYLWGLYDANGTQIELGRIGGGIGYNSHRYFAADANGTYYVEAGAEHGPWVGSYTLAVTELAADAAADTSTTATVAVGSPVTGDIETLGDRDWFSVTLEEGKTYRIDLEEHQQKKVLWYNLISGEFTMPTAF